MKYIPKVHHYRDYLQAWDDVRYTAHKQMLKKDYNKARRNIFDITFSIFSNLVDPTIQNTFIMKFSKSSFEAAWKLL